MWPIAPYMLGRDCSYLLGRKCFKTYLKVLLVQLLCDPPFLQPYFSGGIHFPQRIRIFKAGIQRERGVCQLLHTKENF